MKIARKILEWSENMSMHKEHRQRLREKYSRFGHDNLFDYEKIELLLMYAKPRVDVKPLAKELLHRFGGIAGILNAGRDEVLSVPGVGEQIANLILLVRNLGADFHKEHLLHKAVFTCSADVIRFAKMKLATKTFCRWFLFLIPRDFIRSQEWI